MVSFLHDVVCGETGFLNGRRSRVEGDGSPGLTVVFAPAKNVHGKSIVKGLSRPPTNCSPSPEGLRVSFCPSSSCDPLRRFIKDTAVQKLMAVCDKALAFRKEQEDALGHSGGCSHARAKKLGDVTTLNLTSEISYSMSLPFLGGLG